MPDTSTSAVAGGTGTVPTPANNVNGQENNADGQGLGHVDVSANAVATLLKAADRTSPV